MRNVQRDPITVEQIADAIETGKTLGWIEGATKRFLRLTKTYAEENEISQDKAQGLGLELYRSRE